MTHEDIATYAAVVSALCTVLTTAVAFFGTKIALKTFANQRTSNDVAVALSLFKEINGYWDNLSSLDSKSPNYIALYEYNMGQILSYFEISCSMLNKGVLTKDASDVLSAHIIEVFTSLEISEYGKTLIEKCQSSNQTFEELRLYSKNNFPKALNAAAFGQDTIA